MFSNKTANKTTTIASSTNIQYHMVIFLDSDSNRVSPNYPNKTEN